MRRYFLVLLFLSLSAAFSFAATLTGTVKNATSGKAAGGDAVELLALAQGMSVIAQTKADANGTFKFELDDPNVPHLVRVTHDGVSFFPAGGPVRPGVNTVEISVYDAAKKLDGISTTVNVLRVQTDNSNLQVLELIAVKNDSQPPRALMSDRTYEFYLPEKAQLDQALIQGPGGMPVNVSPIPDGKGGKYHFNSALKPGETRFEIAYHLPYSGEAAFTPKVTDNVQHFVVMMPKSMSFEAKSGARFSPMNEDNTANIQVATNVTPDSDLSFRISGSGVLPEDSQQGGGGQQPSAAANGQAPAMSNDSRPGGGLGPPIDAPDPLEKYKGWILAGLAVVLVSGGVFVVSRANQSAAPVDPTACAPKAPAKAAAAAAYAPPAAPVKGQPGMLLEALKEELFELEIEKQQGKISAEEYEKTKAALDQTLGRALSRAKNS